MFLNFIKRLLANKKNFNAFSIIEMMIVLVLIGIISTLSISTVTSSLAKAKIKAAHIQSYELSRLLDIYKLQFGNYPSEKEGWNNLLFPPDNIPLIKKIPMDPWDNQYIYMYPGERNLTSPDVVSRGPDGIFSQDDIGNWDI
jgi:general secretion pathway protein G